MSPETKAALEHWARTESFTRDAAGVNRMMDLAEAMVRDAPVTVERLPGRDGLGDTLVIRGGPRTDHGQVLVMGHLDTVHPPGTVASALPVRTEGDKLFGPGLYDMKAGTYLALEAFLDVVRRDAARVPLTFLVTPDEEIGSPTTRALIEDEARTACRALVPEPARDGGRIVIARKGVGLFDVQVEGRASHAGTHHHLGRSAVREAARLVGVIEAMTDPVRGVTTNVGVIKGGTARNVVPQFCEFEVDVRVTTPEDAEAVTTRLLALSTMDGDVKVRVTGGLNRPPWPVQDTTLALFAQAKALAAEAGWVLDHVPLTGGGSDGNFTAAAGCPTLDGLGIDGAGAHTLQEHILMSSFVPRRHLMTRLIESASAGHFSPLDRRAL